MPMDFLKKALEREACGTQSSSALTPAVRATSFQSFIAAVPRPCLRNCGRMYRLVITATRGPLRLGLESGAASTATRDWYCFFSSPISSLFPRCSSKSQRCPRHCCVVACSKPSSRSNPCSACLNACSASSYFLAAFRTTPRSRRASKVSLLSLPRASWRPSAASRLREMASSESCCRLERARLRFCIATRASGWLLPAIFSRPCSVFRRTSAASVFFSRLKRTSPRLHDVFSVSMCSSPSAATLASSTLR
mmetsp:Transcript_18077/g.51243  ORF Transcript_18077/g.51243 Transcript_18077/m.51243 type:complete len:251 (+) Transcript_18077:238-990(+)